MNLSAISVNTPKIINEYKVAPARFASALAHEVRNPLTNIKLSIGRLESEVMDSELKKYLDIIRRSSSRINDLITDLLNFQQEYKVQAGSYSISQLLEEVLEIAEDRIRLKNITVRKNFSAQDCKIVLNKPEVRIALTNIVVNAIDAMTSGKGELKLLTKSIEDKYVIEISDNGCGISEKNLKNIFKPYFSNKVGGLGLGLSVTYDILQSNNASVNVDSVEGEGTRFTLLFNKNLSV